MKKFIFMFVAMFAMVATATAQQSNYAGSSRFFDNWTVGVTGGVQTNLHDWNVPQGAVTNLYFEKSITPTFSLGFEGQVGFNNVANWLHPTQMHAHNGTVVDQVNTYLYGKFNLMNAFGGYKGTPRLFELSALAGVGYQHNFGNTSAYNFDDRSSLYGSDGWLGKDNLLAKTGIELAFNLGEKKAWSLNVRPAVVWNVTHNDAFDCRWAVGEITAGVAYHFGTSNHKHHFELPVPVVVEKPVEVVVEKVVVKEVERVVTNTVTVSQPTHFNVQFAQGSSTIVSDITPIVSELKNTDGVYTITGFTSPEGSEKVNKALGLARANALKNALVAAGVDSNKIVVDNSYETLRTATVTLK